MVRTPQDPLPGHGEHLREAVALMEAVAGKQQEAQDQGTQQGTLEQDECQKDETEQQQDAVFHKKGSFRNLGYLQCTSFHHRIQTVNKSI